MEYSFGELIRKLAAERIPVSIGSGQHELHGTVLSYDGEHRVLVYRQAGAGGLTHYIPLTSIRSIGMEDTLEGPSCFIDLVKK
jgi:hypothetical protein